MVGAPHPSPTRRPKAKPWTSILLNGAFVDPNAKDYHRKGNLWSLGYHTGEDFGAKVGTEVRTPMAGKVVRVGYEANGLGNYITIKMTDGNYIVFGHLAKVGQAVGTWLPAGSYVGKSGATGNVTAPHLHVEIRTAASGGQWGAGNFMDPIAYLNSHVGKVTTTGSKKADPWVPPPTADTGGSSSSSSSGGGGGGISGVGGFTRADYLKWLDANFGNMKYLRELDAKARQEVGGKSIDWLVNTLADKKITDPSIVRTYLAQTGWFKKYGEQTTLRLISEKERPGEFADQVKAQRAVIDAQLDALGFHLSDDALNQMARASYIYDWDPARVVDEAQRQYADSKSVTYDGGDIGAAVEQLTQYAWSLGVDLTSEDVRSIRRDILDGTGVQSQLDELQKRSANTYTVFADQILAGQSLRQAGGAYFQKMADMLELGSPDAIEMSDPLMVGGRAFMTADPATGKMVPKGLWDFEKDIRKDSRWLNTKNARDSMSQAAGQILSLMGLG